MIGDSSADGLRWRFLVGGLAAVVFVPFYGVSRFALVGAGDVTSVQLFTLAFLYGAAAILIATFVANFVAQRVFGEPGIAYRLPRRGRS